MGMPDPRRAAVFHHLGQRARVVIALAGFVAAVRHLIAMKEIVGIAAARNQLPGRLVHQRDRVIRSDDEQRGTDAVDYRLQKRLRFIQLGGSLLDADFEFATYLLQLREMRLPLLPFALQGAVSAHEQHRQHRVEDTEDPGDRPEHDLLPCTDLLEDLRHVRIDLEDAENAPGVRILYRDVLLMQIDRIHGAIQDVFAITSDQIRDRLARQCTDHALVAARVAADLVLFGREQYGGIGAIDLDLDDRHPLQLLLQAVLDPLSFDFGESVWTEAQRRLQAVAQQGIVQHDCKVAIVRAQVVLQVRVTQLDVKEQQRHEHQTHTGDADQHEMA